MAAESAWIANNYYTHTTDHTHRHEHNIRCMSMRLCIYVYVYIRLTVSFFTLFAFCCPLRVNKDCASECNEWPRRGRICHNQASLPVCVCVCVFRRPCSTAIFAQNLLATALGQMNDSCCLQAVFVIDMVIVSKLYAFRLSTEKTMGKYLQSNFRLPAIWETCRCFKANTKCNWSMQNQSQPLFWHE